MIPELQRRRGGQGLISREEQVRYRSNRLQQKPSRNVRKCFIARHHGNRLHVTPQWCPKTPHQHISPSIIPPWCGLISIADCGIVLSPRCYHMGRDECCVTCYHIRKPISMTSTSLVEDEDLDTRTTSSCRTCRAASFRPLAVVCRVIVLSRLEEYLNLISLNCADDDLINNEGRSFVMLSYRFEDRRE